MTRKWFGRSCRLCSTRGNALILLDHYPSRLTGARRDVAEAHPASADVPRLPDEDTLEALRLRVAAAADDPAALERLSRRLTPKETRGLVVGITQWSRLETACGHLLNRCMKPRLLSLLWRAWQAHPLHATLRDVLVAGGERLGWERALALAEAAPGLVRQYASAAPGWVQDPTSIVSWLASQDLSHRDLPGLKGHPIRPGSPLARVVRDTLMTSGALEQLRAESSHLIDWFTELPPALRIQSGQHYLRTLPEGEWHDAYLLELATAYGPPRKPMVTRFWEGLSNEIREAFHRHYIASRIEQHLGHDHDRAQFWRRWAEHMADVEEGSAGGVGYAYMDFGPFMVVEFFLTGNAAHFYTSEDADMIRQRDAAAPWRLKEQRFYGIGYGDNRLIHNPAHGWHSKGDNMVLDWLAHFENLE